MKTEILGLMAETSIHPGSGQDAGFVDLPVAREAATDYPVIVGSSFKGALRDVKYQRELETAKQSTEDEDEAKRQALSRTEVVFGKQENAGALIVSDVRLVALPVRSLTSTYKWATCPHLIERLSRDRKRAGRGAATGQAGKPDVLDAGKYIGAGDGDLYLEERQFTHAGDLAADVLELFQSLVADESAAARLQDQLVILHDDDFAWFARYGLAINARNVLDNEKKTSKNLWYEETIPPDSLFYCLLAERGDAALATVKALFREKPYIQVGANETVGQGWFAIRWLGGDA
jgi:CRISPR-associated protein Cmr4